MSNLKIKGGLAMGTLMKTNGSFFPELPSVFDDFLTKDLFRGRSEVENPTLPAVNVRETDESYELDVAAPGMSRKDFKVELDNNMLVISAEHQEKDEKKEGKGDYTRREFHYQSFTRSFGLPENMVESDKISAKYSDGILHIRIPKSENAKQKPPKLIEIS